MNAYYPIFGVPLIIYAGIITFLLVVATAVLGMLVLKGKASMRWHTVLAWTAIILAALHGFLALSSRL